VRERARGIKKNSKKGGQTPLAVFVCYQPLRGGRKRWFRAELVCVSELADHGFLRSEIAVNADLAAPFFKRLKTS
jgi:hypothetical protein